MNDLEKFQAAQVTFSPSKPMGARTAIAGGARVETRGAVEKAVREARERQEKERREREARKREERAARQKAEYLKNLEKKLKSERAIRDKDRGRYQRIGRGIPKGRIRKWTRAADAYRWRMDRVKYPEGKTLYEKYGSDILGLFSELGTVKFLCSTISQYAEPSPKVALIMKRTGTNYDRVKKIIRKAILGESLNSLEKNVLITGWPSLFGRTQKDFKFPDSLDIIHGVGKTLVDDAISEDDRVELAMKATKSSPTRIAEALDKFKSAAELNPFDKKILKSGGWISYSENFAEIGNELEERIESVTKKLDVDKFKVLETITDVLNKKYPYQKIKIKILTIGWPELFGTSEANFKIPEGFFLQINLNEKFAGKRLTEKLRKEIAGLVSGAADYQVDEALKSAKKGEKLTDREMDIIKAGGWFDLLKTKYKGDIRLKERDRPISRRDRPTPSEIAAELLEMKRRPRRITERDRPLY